VTIEINIEEVFEKIIIIVHTRSESMIFAAPQLLDVW